MVKPQDSTTANSDIVHFCENKRKLTPSTVSSTFSSVVRSNEGNDFESLGQKVTETRKQAALDKGQERTLLKGKEPLFNKRGPQHGKKESKEEFKGLEDVTHHRKEFLDRIDHNSGKEPLLLKESSLAMQDTTATTSSHSNLNSSFQRNHRVEYLSDVFKFIYYMLCIYVGFGIILLGYPIDSHTQVSLETCDSRSQSGSSNTEIFEFPHFNVKSFTNYEEASMETNEEISSSSLFYLSIEERKRLRDEAREMFYYSFNNYMQHAYPADELMPLSCQGRKWETRDRGTLDDSLGGYALTLVDSLDMFVVIGDYKNFFKACQLVIRDVHFDRDVTISVFEVTIRILGGLLSAHLLLESEELQDEFQGLFPEYKGELLEIAYDLGLRLLPAYATPTGIPVHRVNLRHGVPNTESHETCTAAGGTLLLEMGLLSKLTDDGRFYDAARKAMMAIWQRRSPLNLVGSTINIYTGRWLQTHSGIGAGIDSFYEYLLKSYIMFGDQDMLTMFVEAYTAIEEHSKWGPWNVEVSMSKGKWQPHSFRISALQAFWPGLQVLAGDIQSAKITYKALHNLWSEFEALPEIFDARSKQLLTYANDYPLRPEFVESTYHLYTATKDPYYLDNGRAFLHFLQNNTKVACGYASIGDVRTRKLDDRMDSFFLSETLKYLFLLFDESLDPIDRKSVFCPIESDSAANDVYFPTPVRSSTENMRDYRRQKGMNLHDEDEIVKTRPCISPGKTIFTTEGHMFFVNNANKVRTHKGSLLPPLITTSSETTISKEPQWSKTSASYEPVNGAKENRHSTISPLFENIILSLNPTSQTLEENKIQRNQMTPQFDFKIKQSSDATPTAEQEAVLNALQSIFTSGNTEAFLPFNTDVNKLTNENEAQLILQCENNKCTVVPLSSHLFNANLGVSPINIVLSESDDEEKVFWSSAASPARFGKAIEGLPNSKYQATLFSPLFASSTENDQTDPGDSLLDLPLWDACSDYHFPVDVKGYVGIVERGSCTFSQKVRKLESMGCTAAIILDIDEVNGPVIAMDGDNMEPEIKIPSALLGGQAAVTFLTKISEHMKHHGGKKLSPLDIRVIFEKVDPDIKTAKAITESKKENGPIESGDKNLIFSRLDMMVDNLEDVQSIVNSAIGTQSVNQIERPIVKEDISEEELSTP